ncbi:hypothetical protein J7337_000082 [Fusarium musae]|uniref:Uncharacterized protein n=1 Tax=Fusarium musae TaxID=1042133 RepID=A0A9P8DRA8_9HYPO|nr:hypothetical protein J7337_000082 [Fusarium musae]KAG9506550.1 hypothetical protein J7337_000082 [Fusarium musae]
MSESGCSSDRPETLLCHLTAIESLSHGSRVKWKVKVRESEKESRVIVLEDPDTEQSYSDHDAVLFSSETPNPSVTTDQATQQGTTQDYCRSILEQLNLGNTIKQRSKTGILQIFIDESIDLSGQPSIHALRWELLERSSFFEACGCSVQVTRIYNSARYNCGPPLSLSFQTPIRILLVIARSWQLAPPSSRSHEHFADISPDVVQDTLRDIMKICRQRGQPFTVHVAPGGFKGLMEHLELQKSAGIVYDMVHFDLHGRINPLAL